MNGNGTASKRSNKLPRIAGITATDWEPGPMPSQPVRGAQYHTVKLNQSSGTRAQNLTSNVPYIVLLPLNDTFEPKTIQLPFLPDVVKIGRQTNKSTLPYQDNGYFDSKVLSRAHAEIWANAEGRACIKDIRSSNGTFVNGMRLSKENEESPVRELLPGDTLELGIDILNDDNGTIIHRKVSARIDHAGLLSDSWTQGDRQAATMNGSSHSLNGNKSMYDNASNGSNASLSSMASGMNHMGTSRHNVSLDMVIRKLSNDIKVSKQVSVDLKSTTEAFTNGLSKNSSLSFPKTSPFARRLKSDLSSNSTNDGSTKSKSSSASFTAESDNSSLEQLELVRQSLEAKAAQVEDLEHKLMEEQEARILMEEKWRNMMDAPARFADDDTASITSDATVTSDYSPTVPPTGMDEVSETNGGGVVERLENLLRSAQEEMCTWKVRAETAESQSTMQASRILELVAELEQSRSATHAGESDRLRKAVPEHHEADKRVIRVDGEAVLGTGGRGFAMVSMLGVVMLGIGLMSFLNGYVPKKDY